MSLTSHTTLQNLSDETRLGIVLLLRDGRAVRVRPCTALEQSHQNLPPSCNASGKWPIAGSQTGKMGSLPLIPAYSFLGRSGDWAGFWLNQQDDVQAIARKLASGKLLW